MPPDHNEYTIITDIDGIIWYRSGNEGAEKQIKQQAALGICKTQTVKVRTRYG